MSPRRVPKRPGQTLQVIVDQRLLAWVRARAERDGISLSAVIRQVLLQRVRDDHQGNKG